MTARDSIICFIDLPRKQTLQVHVNLAPDLVHVDRYIHFFQWTVIYLKVSADLST